MSTQLTISIELITFMEWVLKHKSDAFAAFINEAIDPELKDKLALIRNNKDIELSTTQLYATLNDFINSIEKHLRIPDQQPTKRCKHSSKRTKKMNDFDDVESISSPVQKLLYKALLHGKKSSDVH